MKGLALIMVLVVIVLVYLVARAVVQLRVGKWRVHQSLTMDGTILIGVKRGKRFRCLDELPPRMDTTDFRAELGVALENAEQEARVLNRKR